VHEFAVCEATYKLVLLDKVVARLDYDVVFITKNGCDLVRDPLLHQVNVDLFNVNFLVELRWEFGRPQALLIHAHGHDEKLMGWCASKMMLDEVDVR
jgi:hypothetical protein